MALITLTASDFEIDLAIITVHDLQDVAVSGDGFYGEFRSL